jgi:CRP/FNR family cyclic AMP-dependent transcriptional regulator
LTRPETAHTVRRAMTISSASAPLKVRELIRGVALFSCLDEAALASLERFIDVREFPAGAIIVGQEDMGDALFVLASGKVKVVLYGESGREIILSIFRSPGDFFGEMSLLDNEPRSANVIALEPARLLVLSRRDFQAHIQKHPRSALVILTELSRRLRQADGAIGNLALVDVFGRVAGKLREIAESEGEKVQEGILIRERPTQQEIAAMVGTSRETVSRALSEFARRGFITVSGKRILLRNAFLLDELDSL